MDLAAPVFIQTPDRYAHHQEQRRSSHPGKQLCSWLNHHLRVFWLLLLSTHLTHRPAVVWTQPCTHWLLYPTWQMETRGGGVHVGPAAFRGQGSAPETLGSSILKQAPGLRLGVSCQAEAVVHVCPAHRGAGLRGNHGSPWPRLFCTHHRRWTACWEVWKRARQPEAKRGQVHTLGHTALGLALRAANRRALVAVLIPTSVIWPGLGTGC